jgi:hypothetical protein
MVLLRRRSLPGSRGALEGERVSRLSQGTSLEPSVHPNDADTQQGINALTTLRQHIKDSAPSLQEELDKDYSLRQPLQRDQKDARGKDFFGKIYGQHTEKVLHNLSVASGGDLAEFAINAVYGDLMAETSRFDAMQTSLLEFLACYATAGTTTLQAKSHMYGSHNLGNIKAEIRAATAICNAIEAEMCAEIDRTGAEWSWLAKADGW